MWQIYKKEIIELLRDRRTLIFVILMPTLLIPMMMLGFGAFAASNVQKAQNEVLQYEIIGSPYFSNLEQYFSTERGFEYVGETNAEKIRSTITDTDTDFILEFDNSAELGEKSLKLILHYTDASSKSRFYVDRIREVVTELNDELSASIGNDLNLSSDRLSALLKPIELDRQSIASERESKGEFLGGIITYFLVIICLTGAIYPSLEMGVGEKERGTLETLLLTPLSRNAIVFAKFLVIFTTGFLSVFMTLASTLLWIVLGSQGMALGRIMEIFGSIGFTELGLIALMLVPVAAIFSCLMLCASVYAKSTKEAQNYISPIMMLAFVPIIISILPGIELDWFWAMIPITNVALAIKEIIKGTMDYTILLVILGSTAAIAWALLAFCAHWFKKESVLFRS